jgi:hypothetical protein
LRFCVVVVAIELSSWSQAQQSSLVRTLFDSDQ